mgnify:CR=1 FL=1
MELIPVLIELYHDKAKAMTAPATAYSACHDDERIVLLIYDGQAATEGI